MATEALYAHVQSEVANALTVLRTELQQRLQEVATVTNAHEARLIALETSERTSARRENVTAKRETKSLPVFGEKHGPVYADWCFDVFTAMEQVCEEVNLITQWVDSLDTLHEITEANFLVWVRTKGQNVLDMQWALKQLYYVLTQKLTGQVKEFTQAEMGKGIIRGATTWKRVQIHAAGMTQNRRLELLDAVSHPKKANSYDELAELLPAWEKKVRELEKFPQSALSNDQKIGFLRQLANDDLEQFLSHLSATPKSVRPRATTKVKPATKRSRRQEATPWIWAIWTTPARPMIRRQDRKNLTRGKSTLAKAPRSLTHQACTLLDTKVKEKEDGPSTATATTVASLGMRGGTAHAWMKLEKPRWLNVRASFSRAVKKGTMG